MRRNVTVLVALVVVFVAVVTYQLLRRPEEVDLAAAELKVFSQSGEDGVIALLFTIIKPSHRYAVEFGCGDGVKDSNVRNLVVNQGWGGLLMDANPSEIAKAKPSYRAYPRVTVAEEYIFPGNVELLFEQYKVPRDLDLLVIDIDSNDYYVWRAIRDYRPKVVLIEYNAAFPPPQKAVVKFHPLNYWDGSDYFGASIQSLYELGKSKGYELVYCTSTGTNLFFVDKKYFRRLGTRDNSPARLYRPPKYGLARGGRAPNGRGHPPWDTFEEQQNGARVKPYAGDLFWSEVRIHKEFVALP